MTTSILQIAFRRLLLKSQPQLRIYNRIPGFKKEFCSLTSINTTYQLKTTTELNLYQKRWKKNSRSNKRDEDEEEDDDEEDDELANENPLLMDDILGASSDGSQELTIDVPSLRLDTFAKTALGMTRAKVEEAFYKGELYVNGEKAPKKSLDLSQDDEIDLVRQINVEDRNKLDIKRVQIIGLPDKASETGRMKVTIKRWNELTIDSYDKSDD